MSLQIRFDLQIKVRQRAKLNWFHKGRKSILSKLLILRLQILKHGSIRYSQFVLGFSYEFIEFIKFLLTVVLYYDAMMLPQI